MANLTIQASPETYTSGRGGHSVEWIVIHYTGAPGSARNNGIYFSGGNRNASAHYFIDDNDTVLSVPEGDTAWAVGNFRGNQESISIEVCSDGEDFTSAEIERLRTCTLDLMNRYGIDASHVIRHHDVADYYTGRFVDPHKDCPAPYVSGDPTGIKWKTLHDYVTGVSQSASTGGSQESNGGGSTSGSVEQPSASGDIDVDGYWGRNTTKKLQQHFGLYVDGVVSSQYAVYEDSNPGLVGGWDWVSSPKGSPTIRAIQKVVGVEQDGIIGPLTIKAMQRHFGTPVDGEVWGPSVMVKKMQAALNAGTF